MEDSTDLKNIWRTAQVDKLPGAEETVRFIKHYRYKQIVKKSVLGLMLLLMPILMLRVVIYGSNDPITRIGELFIFIGYFVLILSNINSLRRAFNQVNHSNQEFIEYLKQAQRGRLYFYEKVQPLTFVIMTTGLFLYIFESVGENFKAMLTVYILLTISLVIMWFIVRPLINQKSKKKLRETIAKLETLQKDL